MTRYIAVLMAGAAMAAAAPAAAQDCNRDCLITLADNYADALIADNPGAVRWASGAVVMENLAPSSAGAGAFDTITGDGEDSYAIHVADPVSGQVGLLKMMMEGDAPVSMLAPRFLSSCSSSDRRAARGDLQAHHRALRKADKGQRLGRQPLLSQFFIEKGV